jgi:leucyl/phenylalanyl-tRNA--protein transferase
MGVPVFELGPEPWFPPSELAEADGLLAIGGDLSAPRLLAAYTSGVFPWPHEGLPLLWFSPPERMVLPAGCLRVSRRLERQIRQARFLVRLDTAFELVVRGCADAERRDESGTWITPEVVSAYTELHRLGFAHSAESWREGRLVGGLYGVSLGGVFVGESMFASEPNASKVALVTLVRQLCAWGHELFDAQVWSGHMERMGARLWPRARYEAELRRLLLAPTLRGPWCLDGHARSRRHRP